MAERNIICFTVVKEWSLAEKNETLDFSSQTFAWETYRFLEVDAAFQGISTIVSTDAGLAILTT